MRSKRAIKNTAASLLYQFVSIACGLIVPRLLLLAFGSTYNGVVTSATQFLSMVSILNVGIAGPTRVALYHTLANDDLLGTSRIMKATTAYMRKVALFVIPYAGLLCVIYPLVSHNDLTYFENATLIAIVSISTFAEFFFGWANGTLLYSAQRGYIEFSVRMGALVINTLVTAGLILAGANIYVVKLGSSLIYLLPPVLMHIYVRRRFHLIQDCAPDNTAIKNRSAAVFHSVANIVHSNVDIVLLTLFMDAKIISVYTVYHLVTGKIKSVMQSFTDGLEAVFGDMWAKGELDLLSMRFHCLEYSLFAFTGVVFSCTGVLLLPFIGVYTRGITDINYLRPVYALLVTFAEGMFCIRQPYLLLVQATGNYEATKKGALVEALLNLILSLILIQWIGLNGVIIGTFVANVFRTIQFAVFISQNILKNSFRRILFRFIWLGLDCSITVCLAKWAMRYLPPCLGWMSWILTAMLVFAIACAVALILSLLFCRSDFQQVCSIVQGLHLKNGGKGRLNMQLEKWIANGKRKVRCALISARMPVKYVYSAIMQRIYGINGNKVLFTSFNGQTYSDNPRAVSEALHELRPNTEIVWGMLDVKRAVLEVPPYVRVFCISDKLTYMKELATSKAYMSNFGLSYIAKDKSQFFIQSMHGDRGFKYVYCDVEPELAYSMCEAREGYCDLAISGSRYGDETYRSGFRYCGPILKIGMPRCDRLIKRSAAEWARIKEKLNIPKDVKLLLYAPTFRDHEIDPVHKLGGGRSFQNVILPARA